MPSQGPPAETETASIPVPAPYAGPVAPAPTEQRGAYVPLHSTAPTVWRKRVLKSTPPPPDGARSAAASRSLLFSLLPIGTYFVVVLLVVAVAFWIVSVEGAAAILPVILLFGLPVTGTVAGIVFLVIALRNGVRGIRETRGGALVGRGKAIAGLTISGVTAAVWVLSLVWLVVGVADAATS